MRNHGRWLCQSCSCMKLVRKGKEVLGLSLRLLHRNDEKESFSTAAEARIALGAIFLIFLL